MLRFLIEKEFKQLFKNSFLPKLILILPLMVMLVFPWAVNQEIKNVELSVIDHDCSTASKQLIRKIVSSDYFILSNVSANNDQALGSIESGQSDIIIEIEPDFERNLVNRGSAEVMITANAVNGTKANLGTSYLTSILNDFALSWSSQHRGCTVATGNPPVLQLIPQYKFNPHLDYKVYMIPALMVLLLSLLCGFLPALNIVSEKEAGTIEQINVSPVRKETFVLAKLIPYWTVGFVVLLISIGLSAWLYKLFPVGSVFTILLFSSVFVLGVSGLGLIISNYSNTLQQAMFVMFFFILILIFLSGLFTPVSSMPLWAQTLAGINPLKYFMQVMRLIFLQGSKLGQMLPQGGALCLFAIVLNVWAVLSYRKSS